MLIKPMVPVSIMEKMIDKQSKAELEGVEIKKPKDKTLDTATAKKAKEVLNELIKCKAIELIQDEAFTSEHEAPNRSRKHQDLPICMEKVYQAYGEETGNSSETEEDYDFQTLFREENEETKEETKPILETVLRYRSHVQREPKVCDQHEYDVEAHITQPTYSLRVEKLIENTTDLDTGESQSIPVSATYSTRAPVESKLTHPTQADQLQQPVPQTHQVSIGVLSVVSILSILLVAFARPMGNPNSMAASQTSITVNNIQEDYV